MVVRLLFPFSLIFHLLTQLVEATVLGPPPVVVESRCQTMERRRPFGQENRVVTNNNIIINLYIYISSRFQSRMSYARNVFDK